MAVGGGPARVQQLLAITDAALSYLELDVLLDALAVRISEIVGVDACSIAVREGGNERVAVAGPQTDTVSTFVVRLGLGNSTSGELRVATREPREFDTELLHLIAERVTLAIEHARLFESERMMRHRYERVQAVTDVALQHLELEELLQALL